VPQIVESTRKACNFRLDEATREALRKMAGKLGTSQANALGVALGVYPESAFAKDDKRGKLVTR
jgi:hypothetical protein